MTECADLIVGRFYWVMPTIDVDTDAEWENEMQPARFAGTDRNGNLLWHCLNIEGDTPWPMRWIGDEIAPSVTG